MHIKSFTVGAICGAIAIAGASWMSGSSGPNLLADESKFKNELHTEAPTDMPAERQGRLLEMSAAVEPANDQLEVEGIDVLKPADFSPVPITETHKMLLPNKGIPDKHSGNVADVHAALEAEPKDDGWAYYMEQTLQQFLASHPDIVNFEISNIECRTTICELQVVGFDESTNPVWSQIMYDMRHQPWSEFGQTGNSSSTVDGRLAIITHLHRKTLVD